eukprot:2127419-Amphidinium_carterae.1
MCDMTTTILTGAKPLVPMHRTWEQCCPLFRDESRTHQLRSATTPSANYCHYMPDIGTVSLLTVHVRSASLQSIVWAVRCTSGCHATHKAWVTYSSVVSYVGGSFHNVNLLPTVIH